MGNKLSNDELQIKLEVRQGSKVKRQIWREYSKTFSPFSRIFEVLKNEIETSLKYLRRR